MKKSKKGKDDPKHKTVIWSDTLGCRKPNGLELNLYSAPYLHVKMNKAQNMSSSLDSILNLNTVNISWAPLGTS